MVRPRVTPAPRHSCTRSQPLRIEHCDVRRGRTSPPDDCVQTSVTWRRTQSSITKYVLGTKRSPTPDTSPPAEDAHPPRTGRATGPTHRGRTIGLADCAPRISPQPPGCVLAARPARTTTCAPVRPSGPPPPHMSGPPRTPPAKCLPRLNRQPPFPFPGIPEPAAPQPQESPPLWRNVGSILGSIRRLTEGLPKTLWAIPMELLDPVSNMWGVRHHDSPPVSEWCS